jgi:hypothetical protein
MTLFSEIEPGHAQDRALTPAGQGGTGDGARGVWDIRAYIYLDVGGRAGHKHVHSKELAFPVEAEACVVKMLYTTLFSPPCCQKPYNRSSSSSQYLMQLDIVLDPCHAVPKPWLQRHQI